jgi:hypothetical protein
LRLRRLGRSGAETREAEQGEQGLDNSAIRQHAARTHSLSGTWVVLGIASTLAGQGTLRKQSLVTGIVGCVVVQKAGSLRDDNQKGKDKSKAKAKVKVEVNANAMAKAWHLHLQKQLQRPILRSFAALRMTVVF